MIIKKKKKNLILYSFSRHEGVINRRITISGQIIPFEGLICSSCGESFRPNKFEVSLKGVNEFVIF